MRSLFDVFRTVESSSLSISEARRRAACAAKRIAAELELASVASVEMLQAGEMAGRMTHARDQRRAETSKATLKLTEMAHLRLLASLALEMQQAFGQAMGSWVIPEDAAGWGLTSREFQAIAQVSGSRQC